MGVLCPKTLRKGRKRLDMFMNVDEGEVNV